MLVRIPIVGLMIFVELSSLLVVICLLRRYLSEFLYPFAKQIEEHLFVSCSRGERQTIRSGLINW